MDEKPNTIMIDNEAQKSTTPIIPVAIPSLTPATKKPNTKKPNKKAKKPNRKKTNKQTKKPNKQTKKSATPITPVVPITPAAKRIADSNTK